MIYVIVFPVAITLLHFVHVWLGLKIWAKKSSLRVDRQYAITLIGLALIPIPTAVYIAGWVGLFGDWFGNQQLMHLADFVLRNPLLGRSGRSGFLVVYGVMVAVLFVCGLVPSGPSCPESQLFRLMAWVSNGIAL